MAEPIICIIASTCMPFVCLSVCLFVCFFVCLFVCLLFCLFVRKSNDTRWNDRANNFPMVSTHTRVLGDCQLLIRYFPFSVQTSHYWCTILKSETPERFENYLTLLSSGPHPCQENILRNYMQSGRVQQISSWKLPLLCQNILFFAWMSMQFFFK